MKELIGGVIGLAFVGCVIIALQVFGCIARPVNEAINVAQEEFGPRGSLHKYEWFKDVASKLDAKLADIKQYQHRSDAVHKNYEGVPYSQWDAKDKEHLAIWDSEVSGIKASFNELAAQYNAAMSKVNWRFANVGNLPAGATEPLPREYKTYITE